MLATEPTKNSIQLPQQKIFIHSNWKCEMKLTSTAISIKFISRVNIKMS